MATMASARPMVARDAGFFVVGAIVMAAVIVSGFSLHLAMGRSSFDAPPLLHAHALLFFGWTALFVVQNVLVGRGSLAIHRRLGWLAAALVPLLVAMGVTVTLASARRGTVPFVFEPLYFIVMNPLHLLTFAGLTASGIALRRRTQWHRRLLFCAMALLTAPAFGRLLPLPLLIPYAGGAAFAATLLFPLAGVLRDRRVDGTVHPAWAWGIGAMVAAQVAIGPIAASPAGLAFYDWATRGSPGAAVAPRAYPPPPPGL